MIRTNSKKINPGDTFIALRGNTYDGHNYIKEAINNGAIKVIVEEGNYEVETIKVLDTKEYLYNYINEYYVPLIKNLKIIGVTGTNGKTTSCFLIYQMLNMLNKPTAYIGTIGFYIKDKIIELENTTPDILTTYQLLEECVNNNIKYVSMEVSSHALALNRIKFLEFDYAIFTNLTQDHLDFHHDLDNYAITKQKLFKLLKDDGIGIINNDDNYAYLMKINNYITYGFNKSDYHIKDYIIKKDLLEFRFKYQKKLYKVNSYLLGKYNIYNLLTMIITVHKEGISLSDITQKIPLLKNPNGRMDTIIYNNNRIIIDYAHTPDAILNVLNAVKEFSNAKIYSIIGCGGNRDKTKRPLMANYALNICDKVIITNDNPRFENPFEIVKDMLHNNEKDNYEIILNREEAIKRGIEMLNSNDTLVILGKGHENYQIINDEKIYHNDKETVIKIIKG